MRITTSMMIGVTLANISTNQNRLAELQDRITSGQKLRRPQDDPVAVAQAMSVKADLKRVAQYRRNLLMAGGWLNATETALQQVTSLVQRARELAVTASNGALPPQQRGTIAAEVKQLFASAVDLGNSKQGNRYVFGGFGVLDKPFQVAGNPAGYSYLGDSGEIRVEVTPNTTVTVNTPGTRVFPVVLQAMKDLQTALENSDVPGIGLATSALDSALDSSLGELAAIGAKSSSVDTADQRAQDVNIDKQQQLSNLADTDMAEALLQFNTQQAVYQASLKTAGQAIQPSLLDYLK